MDDAIEAQTIDQRKPHPPLDTSKPFSHFEIGTSDSESSWNDSEEDVDDDNGVPNKKKHKFDTSSIQLPPGFLDPLPPLPPDELEDSSRRLICRTSNTDRNNIEEVDPCTGSRRASYCFPCIRKWVSDISELESFGISELITYLRREFQSANSNKVDEKLRLLEQELRGYKDMANLEVDSKVSINKRKKGEISQSKIQRVTGEKNIKKGKEASRMKTMVDKGKEKKRVANKINTADVEPERRVEPLTCHQCHRMDNGDIVRCMNCEAKRYCFRCIQNRYPEMSHPEITESCPFCRGICNCKACLRKSGKFMEEAKISQELLSLDVFDKGIGDLPHDPYMAVRGPELPSEVEDDMGDLPQSEDRTKEEEMEDDSPQSIPTVEHALFIKEMDDAPAKIHDLVYHNPQVQLPVLEIGMEFGSKVEFAYYLRDYCTRHHFVYEFKKNESCRVTAECRGKSKDGRKCNWRCHGSYKKDKSIFLVKTLNPEHICEKNAEDENSWLDFNSVAKIIEPTMREDKRFYHPRDIRADIWKCYQVNITYQVASRARLRALESIHGNFHRSYAISPELCKQILVTNPGSLASVSVDPVNNRWRSLCVCFRASVEGWLNGCRPVLGLKRCFLKGKYGGVCLAIVGLDGNNSTFPIAICLCRSENIEYWYEFLSQMEPFLSRHHLPLTFYLDRQKGTTTAIDRVFPSAHRRFCFRHIIWNMTQKWSGKSLEGYARSAAQTYKKEFDKMMLQLENENEEAANWSIGPDHWSCCKFDSTTKCDYVTNNFTESFNKWMLEVRENPIGEIIKKYQLMLMSHIHGCREKFCRMENGDVVPMVQKNIEKKKQRTGEFVVKSASMEVYSVESATRNWKVNLEARTCTCGEWEVSGIPCLHAVCVIENQRLPWAMYCSNYFTVDYYQRTYSCVLHIIPDMKDWGKPEYLVRPPPLPKTGLQDKKR